MHAAPSTARRARSLRRDLTAPEATLWISLKGRRADGFKFRRQHPIGPFVLDFYCHEARLAVEVDGFVHQTGERPLRDAERDDWLAERGVRTLRVDARDVREDVDGVVRMIVAWARTPAGAR
jgi:very-short-patch-repair endonuclease